MCKNPKFCDLLKLPFEQELNAFQTLLKYYPKANRCNNIIAAVFLLPFKQQSFRVFRGNYPLSFVYLFAILTA